MAIADRGSGIPADKIEQVFEPFFTTKEHGLGLGLAICRSIVTAHGGRLWVTNNTTEVPPSASPCRRSPRGVP